MRASHNNHRKQARVIPGPKSGAFVTSIHVRVGAAAVPSPFLAPVRLVQDVCLVLASRIRHALSVPVTQPWRAPAPPRWWCTIEHVDQVIIIGGSAGRTDSWGESIPLVHRALPCHKEACYA